MIYIDHNATTVMSPSVLAAMMPFFNTIYGNPSSIHQAGRLAREAVENAREIIADYIGASDPSEIVFTSGGTEANNLAIKGVAMANKQRGYHIITSEIEHHSVLNACQVLRPRQFSCTEVGVDLNGRVLPGDVFNSLTPHDPHTILISIMHANNEAGIIQPISEIAELAKWHGILFHTDAVQSFGKIATKVDDLGVDLMSMSAHKIYGPKGIGALYIRKDTPIKAIIHGGHQELQRRAGTENVPGIVGFGRAVELLSEEAHIKEIIEVRELLERLRKGLAGISGGVFVTPPGPDALPNTLNWSHPGIDSEAMVIFLDASGIAVSNGAACESGSPEPSHVLMAMGFSNEVANGSIRFSLGHGNTEHEVDYVIKNVKNVVEAFL